MLDQYLSFIAPSPSLFSLLPPYQAPSTTNAAIPHSSYTILNSPSSSEQQIEEEIERIASGLYSAVVTMGHVPFIRAPKGNAAEMIAKKLEQKIKDALLTASRAGPGSVALFTQDTTGLSNLQRPRKYIIHSISSSPLLICFVSTSYPR